MMRIIGPIVTFVDRPWKVSASTFLSRRCHLFKLSIGSKMYPVGVLFGFGQYIYTDHHP
jgi:hypothetical protein